MGYKKCVGDHRYATRNLGAGLQRLECEICGSVVIDLDAAQDGRYPVTAPGLFRQSKPTIFSVLRRQRGGESGGEESDGAAGAEGRPRHAFGPSPKPPQ